MPTFPESDLVFPSPSAQAALLAYASLETPCLELTFDATERSLLSRRQMSLYLIGTAAIAASDVQLASNFAAAKYNWSSAYGLTFPNVVGPVTFS